MAGLEEVRPLEGMWAPMEVRRDLRQMFGRWLSQSRHSSPVIGADEMVDEQSLLYLCQHYRLEYSGGVEDVAKIWDELEDRIADAGPTFDDLTRLGWVYFDGGRWNIQRSPPGTLSHITYPSPSTKTFLTGLSKVRLVAKTCKPPQDAQTLAAKILGESWLDRHIPTKDPDWLVCRLWERLCPKPQPDTADNSSNIMQAPVSLKNEANGSVSIPVNRTIHF